MSVTGIELQAFYNTLQVATDYHIFKQNSSWISPVQLN